MPAARRDARLGLGGQEEAMRPSGAHDRPGPTAASRGTGVCPAAREKLSSFRTCRHALAELEWP